MLGKLEELTMLGVVECGDEGTAAKVYQAIVENGGGESAFGAVFTTLDRLEAKKLLSSKFIPVTTKAGKKDRKVYILTKEGEVSLRKSLTITNGLARKVGWVLA